MKLNLDKTFTGELELEADISTVKLHCDDVGEGPDVFNDATLPGKSCYHLRHLE